MDVEQDIVDNFPAGDTEDLNWIDLFQGGFS